MSGLRSTGKKRCKAIVTASRGPWTQSERDHDARHVQCGEERNGQRDQEGFSTPRGIRSSRRRRACCLTDSPTRDQEGDSQPSKTYATRRSRTSCAMKKAERRALLGKTELYLISAIFVRLGLQPLDGTGQSPRGVADGSRNQDDEQSSARQVRIRSILICHERERCDETPGSHSPAPNFVECEDVDTCTSLPSLLSHRRKSRRHRRCL
jgi:hypothetical protein